MVNIVNILSAKHQDVDIVIESLLALSQGRAAGIVVDS